MLAPRHAKASPEAVAASSWDITTPGEYTWGEQGNEAHATSLAQTFKLRGWGCAFVDALIDRPCPGQFAHTVCSVGCHAIRSRTFPKAAWPAPWASPPGLAAMWPPGPGQGLESCSFTKLPGRALRDSRVAVITPSSPTLSAHTNTETFCLPRSIAAVPHIALHPAISIFSPTFTLAFYIILPILCSSLYLPLIL